MTCHRDTNNRDHIQLRGWHQVDEHETRTCATDCKGCAPCPIEPERHCDACTRHLDDTELRTCIACREDTRTNLRAVVELIALLPDHARNGSTGRRLEADDQVVGPGGEAINMLAHGSQGYSDDDTTTRPDEQHTPSFVLTWYANTWREAIGAPLVDEAPWLRHPRLVLADAWTYLDRNLHWAAQYHPSFRHLAGDLRRLRRHLEELLYAGDVPPEGVACFDCGATLARTYRDPKPCDCGPRPIDGHIAHHRDDACCLGCARTLLWEMTHAGCDQGGLVDTDPHTGWACTRCRRSYSPGEYQLAVKARHDDVAEYRRLDDAARLTDAKPGSIKGWASKGLVRKSRDESGRVTYHLGDIRRHAETARKTG